MPGSRLFTFEDQLTGDLVDEVRRTDSRTRGPTTLAITPNTGLTNSNPIPFTFTFGRAVTGFTADDINVTNGVKGTFTKISGIIYQLNVTPSAANVSANVNAGGVHRHGRARGRGSNVQITGGKGRDLCQNGRSLPSIASFSQKFVTS